MHISFYCSEYLEGVADLLHEMSVHYNGSNASSRDAVRTNLVSNILAPTSGVTLVLAIENDKVIGLAAISLLYPAPKETAQLFMKELYVSSGHRGQGTGTALMRWIACYAVSKNCTRFDWTVDASNEVALEFYRRLNATHVTDKLYFRFGGDQLTQFADESLV
jgi:GNAT superfamily N-acetyltransferase